MCVCVCVCVCVCAIKLLFIYIYPILNEENEIQGHFLAGVLQV